MASQWVSCKGACSGSDKVSDTVKVDVSKFTAEKENVEPLQRQHKSDQALKESGNLQKAQDDLQQKEAAERQHAEEQAKRRRQQQQVERRCEEMAAAAREREAAERAAFNKKQVLHFQAAAVRDGELCKERQAQQDREAAERVALMEAKRIEQDRAVEQVNTWCKANGFGDMNSKKKSFMSGTKFPLHEAVSKNNEQMVGLMVQLGADKALKNSKGQTAEDLARKMNKNGSMDSILAKL